MQHKVSIYFISQCLNLKMLLFLLSCVNISFIIIKRKVMCLLVLDHGCPRQLAFIEHWPSCSSFTIKWYISHKKLQRVINSNYCSRNQPNVYVFLQGSLLEKSSLFMVYKRNRHVIFSPGSLIVRGYQPPHL